MAENSKDKTIGERKRRLIANNKERGLIQVQLWIPAHKRAEFRALAAQARDAHAKSREKPD